jgi:hypothetical protein
MDPQKLYIRQVTKALESLGQEILNIMKAQAPVKTGKLKRSIRYKVVTKNGNPALSFYYIYYGVYVDLGTYSNADKASYGMSQFIMPKWNPKPGHTGKGIMPRYWTSLSNDATELIEYFASKLQKTVGADIVELLTGVTTKTSRVTS